MSTDKAVVEIPAPVSGRVLSITGKPGDVVAVGSELAAFDTADTGGKPNPRRSGSTNSSSASHRGAGRGAAAGAQPLLAANAAGAGRFGPLRPRGGARRRPASI